MIIDEDGEISELTEEDFKRAVKNPYAERIQRSRTFFLNESMIRRFDELAEEEGSYRDEFINTILLNYLEQVDKTQTEAGE